MVYKTSQISTIVDADGYNTFGEVYKTSQISTIVDTTIISMLVQGL